MVTASGTPKPLPHGHLPFRVVVVVASEGGLDALSHLLSHLPATFGAPIAVVQHRSMQCPELLAALLRRRTPLAVRDVHDGDELCPGVVYIAPPGIHLLVAASGRFVLRAGSKVKHARPSGDVLFMSAAEAFGSRVIGLVLTGGDGDGADGISVVKQHGGIVISQSEQSARAPSMPRSAIETGDVDFVLSLDEIAAALVGLLLRGAIVEHTFD